MVVSRRSLITKNGASPAAPGGVVIPGKKEFPPADWWLSKTPSHREGLMVHEEMRMILEAIAIGTHAASPLESAGAKGPAGSPPG